PLAASVLSRGVPDAFRRPGGRGVRVRTASVAAAISEDEPGRRRRRAPRAPPGYRCPPPLGAVRGQIVLVALAFGSLLLYSGYGILRLLAFDRLGGGGLGLAPAVGAAFLITVGSWVASFGFSAGVALVVAVIITTVLNLLSLRSGRHGSPDVWATVAGGCL